MLRWRRSIDLTIVAAVLAPLIASCDVANAEDRMLQEAVNFNGAIVYLATQVPGFLLVAVRNGETAVAGFGDIADKRGKTPDGDTLFRIGSISKVFCGEALASAVLDGYVDELTKPTYQREVVDGHKVRARRRQPPTPPTTSGPCPRSRDGPSTRSSSGRA